MYSKEPYVIGETAYNHEGDIHYLYLMIDDMSEMELNCVKFHLLLDPSSYFQKKHPLNEGIQKYLFSIDQWKDILDYSGSKGLDVVALCDDVKSIEFINRHYPGLFAIELHATCLNDYFLLQEVANFSGKIILGIGGSTLDEIQYAIDFLYSHNKKDILLMYGFQSYPTNYQDINLSKMLKLKELFDLEVGYADHTGFDDSNNISLSCMAASMGFNVLEKHYTPDYGKERMDYHSAVSKDQMLQIRKLMKISLEVYGSGSISMSKPELKYGNTGPMKKAIVASKNILKGEILSLEHLSFKRTEEESSIKQNMLFKLIGLEAKVNIEEDEIVDFSKVDYKFKEQRDSDFTNIEK
ncbi:MAG: N-acetylneuraminate synthase family protein [Bacteroidales bacterium]|nr:N-acetylneuraminate synthase family protein [Bacteroidales bacterium]